jgi:hypothetical protein
VGEGRSRDLHVVLAEGRMMASDDEMFACDACATPVRLSDASCPACGHVFEVATEDETVEEAPASSPRSKLDPERVAQWRAKCAEKGINIDKAVIAYGTDLDRLVTLTIRELAREESIFDRDGYLVTILRASEDDAERKRAPLAVGSPIIREIGAASLKEKVAALVRYVKKTAKGLERDVPVPSDVVAAVLARGEWSTVRPLVGLLEAPSLRPDGTIIDSPGYDPATGYLYVPSAAFPPVPEQPSEADAERALAELREPFEQFPWAGDTEELRAAHSAVPLALLLTMIARPAIAGAVPAFLIDANEAGTGKTLLVQAPAAIAHGRAPSLMSWPSDEAELEKVLGAYAVAGAAHVAFDNLTRPFAGAPLDKVLTAGDRVQLRILGKTEAPSLPWRAVVTATGNNLEVHGDTMRRVLVCRVDAQVERPEEREGFTHPDLIQWCLMERPRLVCAALTILRAFVVAGRPAPNPPLKAFGSFEAWAALVPAALIFAGAGNVLRTRQELQAKGDPVRLALGTLLAGWAQLDPDGNGLSAKDVLARLYGGTESSDGSSYEAFVASVVDELTPVRDAVETLCPQRGHDPRPTAHQLGLLLRRSRDRVVGRRVLRGEVDRNGVGVWRVETLTSGDAS